MKLNVIRAALLLGFLIFLWGCHRFWGDNGLLIGNVFGGSVFMVAAYVIDQRFKKTAAHSQDQNQTLPWWM